jgi:hypothetical protein
MKRHLLLSLALLAASAGAQAQTTYCRQISGNKTYCSGGVIVHQFGNTTVIPNTTPYEPQGIPTLPNATQQNNSMPTFAAPYSPAGTQNMLAPATPYQLPVQPAPQQGQVLVVPSAGSRICHQFGTVMVCN